MASRAGDQLLLSLLDQAYHRKSWHGTNLRGAIRGLTAADAAWRPAPGRHNIHELVLHAAYWKYAVLNRLNRGQRGSFAIPGSNWFARDDADAAAWKDAVKLLDRMHAALRGAVAAVPSSTLWQPLPGSTTTPFALISGVAAHDLYHAGQIQLIKVLRRAG